MVRRQVQEVRQVRSGRLRPDQSLERIVLSQDEAVRDRCGVDQDSLCWDWSKGEPSQDGREQMEITVLRGPGRILDSRTKAECDCRGARRPDDLELDVGSGHRITGVVEMAVKLVGSDIHAAFVDPWVALEVPGIDARQQAVAGIPARRAVGQVKIAGGRVDEEWIRIDVAGSLPASLDIAVGDGDAAAGSDLGG